MEKTLYVTDLDGTLLNRRDRVSPFSIRVINELVENGLLFTYATARSLGIHNWDSWDNVICEGMDYIGLTEVK